MKTSDYEKLQAMTNKLIAFINWKGADFSSKKKKVIKEISLIKEFCKATIDEENPAKLTKKH